MKIEDRRRLNRPLRSTKADREIDKKHFSPGDLPGEKVAMAFGQKEFSISDMVINQLQVCIISRSGRLVFGLQRLQSKEI